ncbi:MAG TPA: UbiA family prenyltransferase [Azospira sp.]|nr:UbiA family prenyltransferase [Azospira sp.]
MSAQVHAWGMEAMLPAMPLPESPQTTQVPLCVDLDGSLIATDLLHESVFGLLKTRPWLVFCLPLWLLGGKAQLKTRLAALVEPAVETLPYQPELLAMLDAERRAGRAIILATASAQRHAEAVAAHLGLFDRVLATSATTNLSAANKARVLCDIFGERGFDYVGNSGDDLAVWAHSRGGYLVGCSPAMIERARGQTEVLGVFERARPGLLAYLRALRVHQWLKNLLVFLPLLAAHRLQDGSATLAAALAFVAFSLCASSVYLLNDLLDLPSDRAHVRKRKRPFASGLLPVAHGTWLMPLLLLAAALIGLQLPPLFAAALGGYFVLTLAYSIWLKNQVIVDVLLLACLYTSRVLAGAAATRIEPSFWLLAFSMFIFLSLAMVKRYSEMLVVLAQQKSTAPGRGYSTADLPVLIALGTSSGMMAILVVALYVNSPEVVLLYRHPWMLWLLPLGLLYWISRIWMKTHRGEMHDDPLVFAATDWQSLAVGLLLGAALVAGTLA